MHYARQRTEESLVLAQTSITDSFECPGAARRQCTDLWITGDAQPTHRPSDSITSFGALRQTLGQGRRERRCSGPFRWKERPKLGRPVPLWPARGINPRPRLSQRVVSLVEVILGAVGCQWQPTVSLAFASLSCMAAASSCSSAAQLYRGHCRSRRARLLCCSGVSKYLLISIPQSFCS